ncbi:hypothetical protein RMCBS344292_05124 [Rhizopus microsporus]|nr:hypothetical protein RMCBS344292_05124 [Rhizopus microsporus]
MSSLVVYGDSYSDLHVESKRTNGPVWSQVLAEQWDAKLISFARSGARICPPSNPKSSWLKKQVDESLLSIEKGSIHAIFLGTTDLVVAKGNTQSRNKEWIGCIEDQVTAILEKDPEARILILGAPALEFSPFGQKHKDQLKDNIMSFKVDLEEKVEEWKGQDKNVEFYDTYLMFSNLLGDPSEAKITNVDDAYWDKCQGQCNDEMNQYLWWDSLHMTGAGHIAMAKEIASFEFFGIKASEPTSILAEAEDTVDNNSHNGSNLSQNYIQCLSWLLLGCVFMMIIYSFRHSRFIVSLKSKFHSKTSRLYRNKDYTLV